MKFTLSILALLAIAFLVGCSAKDTSSNNKLSNSEITKLGKKYGGVYVFNKKFEKEIDDRERERGAVNRQILDEVSRISDKDERNKKMRKLLKERYYNNPKIAQTLSNGKKYYTSTRSYEQDYKKAVNVSKKYINEVINFIGQEDYNKFKPSIDIGYFYVDNDEIVPIELSATYSYQGTKYGFFGDEGRGFALSRDEIYTVKGGNRFYLEDTEKR
ncbi:tRNA 2-selenouridine synthase [uncultured Campylobacter sp.]|uniref:tRNA 2-selenouridine synthase n=1 Tax=uncultured Campylobacter sp. TaxID=218934 RepID=UPI002635B85B|nr:tRNA 2-selenouridine synthase [uncultured Campylobacter sp.]